MEFQRGPNGGDSSTESTSTPTHDSSDKATSAAEEQQLADDLYQFEYEVQEAGQEEELRQDEGENGNGTDTELSPLVGRQRDDASSNDSSEGSYNHTDHDSSIEGSDDERSTVPGLQQRDRVDSSSDDDSTPPLVGRQRDDANSDSSTSEGSYNYYTDNDNSSIEGSDDGGNNISTNGH